MSSRHRKSQKGSFDVTNIKTLDSYFHPVLKEKQDNSSVPQMKAGIRKGPRSTALTQAQEPKDKTISPKKVLYITLNIPGQKNHNREHRLRHDERDSLSEALNTLQAVKHERNTRPGKELLVQGTEGIEGYVNLGMPLSCLPETCHLTIRFAQSKSEEMDKNQIFGRHDKASMDCVKFFIHAVGKTRKRIVKCKELHKEGCKLCVFAFKGETVKDAMCKDSRFLSLLENQDWKLIENLDSIVGSTQQVDDLEGKLFEVEVEKRRPSRAAATQNCDLVGTPNFNLAATQNCDVATTQNCDVATTQNCDLTASQNFELEARNTSVLKVALMTNYPSLKEVAEKIRVRFKKEMKGRRGKRIFQLHKTDFGKLTKNSTLMKTHKHLSHLGDSVGYITWDNNGNRGNATCFVFSGLFIFTNHHTIRYIVGEGIEPSKWAGIISQCAKVTFSYEDSEEKGNYLFIEPWFEVFDRNLDYAILQLKENGQVPRGLYNGDCHVPLNGLIYLIGHPDGEPKSIDACIIVPQAQRKGEEHLQVRIEEGHKPEQFIDLYTQRSFQGTDNMSKMLTYNTSFYFGASGSPVFDSKCSLVAMHTAGFYHPYQTGGSSMIEFGFTIEAIIHNIKQNHGKWWEEFCKAQDVEMVSDED